MNDFEMPASVCPGCGYVCDHAASMEDADRPSVGDVTICINCASVYVFAADLTLRKPTADEEARFPLEVARYQLEIRKARKLAP